MLYARQLAMILTKIQDRKCMTEPANPLEKLVHINKPAQLHNTRGSYTE
jgi:hypothetical protein